MLDLPFSNLTRDFQNIKIASKVVPGNNAQSAVTLLPLSVVDDVFAANADSIPSELWILIFSNLTLLDIGITRRVCKKFRFASNKVFDSICRGLVPGFMKPILLIDIGQENSGISGNFKLTPKDLRDLDWIEFGLEDADNLHSHGFIGLASKIDQICSPLFCNLPEDSDNAEDRIHGPLRLFDREAYSSLNNFLQNGWKSLEESLPATLRPAYGSLIKRILNIFDSLVDRPSDTMPLDTQLLLLTQVWRLMDILPPKTARDYRFETPSSIDRVQTYYYDLLIKLERELGLGVPDRRVYELDPIAIIPSPYNPSQIPFTSTTNWEWNCEKGKLRSVTIQFTNPTPFPVHFEITGLQHGESFEFCSFVNVRLRVPKVYLLSPL